MSSILEIERKFLLKFMPDLDSEEALKLRQGYITTGRTEVRLRSDGKCNTLTCKRGEGLVRQEYEISVTDDQFDALWPLTDGCRISKTRHRLGHHGKTIEIDVYEGSLRPLMVAEVEFDSESESQEFQIPDFIGREVTDDHRYKNKNLALEGLPLWVLVKTKG